VASGALIGCPETIRERLTELEAVGVQELILGFPDILHLDTLRFFARECLASFDVSSASLLNNSSSPAVNLSE
jgi:hypothetical protein